MNQFSKLSFSLILVVSLAGAFACKRNQKPIAGVKKAAIGSPEFEATPNVSANSGSVLVAGLSGEELEKILTPAELYQQDCSACHQVTGQGIPGAFPPLDGSVYVTSDNVERMASIMIYGLAGPIKVKGVQYNSAMAGLGSQSDENLAKIATYVRSNWSNKAGEVKPDVFASMRKKWGTRGPFNITELGEEPN